MYKASGRVVSVHANTFFLLKAPKIVKLYSWGTQSTRPVLKGRLALGRT